MVLLRIISVILTLSMIVSCAPKGTVKEEVKETTAAQPPAEELKLPELPQKPEKPAPTEAEVKKSEPFRVEKEGEEKYIILNFDGADIETVIATIGELLNINYILAPGVTGKVTIQSYRKFPVKDLFQIFQTILEINGLTAIKDGTLYRIVPIDMARQQPVPIQSGKELKLQLDSSFITQIIPLEYVRANDIVNVIKNLMPRGTDLIVYEPNNLLIVTAQPAGLIKFMKILEALDVPATERESVKTFVYYVENGDAKKLAETLKSLYAEKKEKKTSVPIRPTAPAPTPMPAPSQPKTGVQAATATTIEGLPGEVEGEIVITAYEDINGLIIKASPATYLAILEALKKLDIPAKQVLIEVLVAEVALTDNTQLGLEWVLGTSFPINGDNTIKTFSGFVNQDPNAGGVKGGAITGGTTTIGNAIAAFPAVTPFASIIKPDRFGAILTAFAGLGKVNVLASPHILAVDNKEAKIEIGSEVPIATGLTQQPVASATTTATQTLVSSGQIQYKTIGTILTVTPHITEKNQVTMKISQESSALGQLIPIAGQNFQGFNTRKAQTTAVVQDGHTLVIGGLIEQTKNESSSGLPLLSRIPLLGVLFGTKTNTVEKTELLVMVTPHVISNQNEADIITKEFQNKVKTITVRLKEVKTGMLSVSRDVATVYVEKNSSLMEIIEKEGYTLRDADRNAFLNEFMALNEDIKNIKMIPEGTTIKLPLSRLKKGKSEERG